MQINIIDDDILTPVYSCGKRGESIDVQVHGVNYTTWKLLDNLEKHVGKRSKIACKTCYDLSEKNGFEQLAASFLELSIQGKNLDAVFTDLIEVLDTKKDTNDQEEFEVQELQR